MAVPLLRMVAFPALVVLLVLGGCANLILGMQVKLCALQAIPVDFLSATYIAADDIEFPAREVPGLAAMLLAVRDVNLRNCAIVKGCDSLLLSRPDGSNNVTLAQPVGFNIKDLTSRPIPKAATGCGELGADFIIGPPTSSQSQFATHVGLAYDMAVISPSATSPKLSDKELHPLFSRTSPSDALIAAGVGDIIKVMGWRQAVLFHLGDAWGTAYANKLAEFVREWSGDDVTLTNLAIGESPTQEDFDKACQHLAQSSAKVVVLTVHTVHTQMFVQGVIHSGLDMASYTIIVGGTPLEGMLSRAKEFDMLPYLEGWLGVGYEWDEELLQEWSAHLASYIFGPDFPEDVRLFMTASGGTGAGIGDGEGQQALKDAVLAATSKLDPASDFGPDTWVPQTYDAVWAASIASSRAIAGDGGLGARAIQALRSNAIEPFQSATVRNRTWDSNADPVMGSVRMLIHSYNKQPGSEVAQRHLVATVDGNEFNFSGTAKLVWADGTIYPQVPSDGTSKTFPVALAASITSLILLALIVASIATWLARKNRQLYALLNYHNKGLANELDLETPVAKIYGFLENLKRKGKFSKVEVEQLQTLLVTSDNLKAPDIEAELKGKHNYSAGIGQYLLDTMKVRSGFEVAKSFRQFQSVNFPSEDEEQSCTTGKSMIATDKERSSLASLKCFLGHGDVANSEQLASLRDGIGMDFLQDTFLLHELTGGRPLAFACAQLAISLGLCRAPFTEDTVHHEDQAVFVIPFCKFFRYISAIEEGYDENVPYHNATHAADVTCRFFAILRVLGAVRPDPHNSSMQRFATAMLVSAAAHDYMHPGKNNQFQIKIGSKAAVAFNDQHVLEMLSLHEALKLMNEPQFNFIDRWPEKDKAEFRETVISMVLATDMSRHFDIVGAFSSKFVKEHVSSHGYITKNTSFRHGQRMSIDDQACRSNTVKRFKSLDQTTQILSLQVALKVADTGHCMAPFDVHQRWSKCLEEEFLQQGDAERDQWGRVSPLMDRNLPSVCHPLNQIGFQDLIILPMLQIFTEIFPGTQLLLETAERNKEMWKKLADDC